MFCFLNGMFPEWRGKLHEFSTNLHSLIEHQNHTFATQRNRAGDEQ